MQCGEVVAINNEEFNSEYQAGKAAFERGRYNASIQHLEVASELSEYATRWGGEVRIWLVTAYHAAHQDQQAVALCQKLRQHPHPEIRQQSRRLAEIITAPKLKRPQEWMVKIPDLAEVEASELKNRYVSSAKPQSSTKPKQPLEPAVDLSEVETEDNLFIWVAIALCLICGLLYLVIGY